MLRETRERNGWLIFYTHDVADAAELDRLLAAIVANESVEAVQAEDMPCLTDPRRIDGDRL